MEMNQSSANHFFRDLPCVYCIFLSFFQVICSNPIPICDLADCMVVVYFLTYMFESWMMCSLFGSKVKPQCGYYVAIKRFIQKPNLAKYLRQFHPMACREGPCGTVSPLQIKRDLVKLTTTSNCMSSKKSKSIIGLPYLCLAQVLSLAPPKNMWALSYIFFRLHA
jgi:hypothetical protein